jgi:hypothetical protein
VEILEAIKLLKEDIIELSEDEHKRKDSDDDDKGVGDNIVELEMSEVLEKVDYKEEGSVEDMVVGCDAGKEDDDEESICDEDIKLDVIDNEGEGES